ncbi:MAG: hypothetical protein ABEJ40_08315 [Haloarculaceae archaeon]
MTDVVWVLRHGQRQDSVDPDHDPLLEPTFPEDHRDAEQRIGEAARRVVAHTDARRVLLVGHGATVGGVAAGLVGSTDGVDAPLAGTLQFTNDDTVPHTVRLSVTEVGSDPGRTPARPPER